MESFDATPTVPDGSYWQFVQLLWQSQLGEVDSDEFEHFSGVPIAEVAFFTHGFVRAWYFTARDGTLRRKMTKHLSIAELAKHLCAGKPLPSSITPTDNDPGDVVALAVFGPGGKMDAAGRKGSSVAALERGPLCWLLNPDDAKRRSELQAIVRYVRPRGGRESVLRFDWRAQVSSYELRSACAPLQAGSSNTIVPAYQRLSTHGPAMCFSQKEKHVPVAAVERATEVCARLAARVVGADCPREHVRICADFKLLGGDEIVLQWAACVGSDAVCTPEHMFSRARASSMREHPHVCPSLHDWARDSYGHSPIERLLVVSCRRSFPQKRSLHPCRRPHCPRRLSHLLPGRP